MNTLSIFRAGSHTDMGGRQHQFTDADVAAMAKAYDPSRHEAPLVVGHPAHDAPAYGWVEGLTVTPTGHLTATPRQVDPQFADMVRQGRYKKLSASFYTPDSPNNPVPGSYYLRHVGFLGAQPPAIKGLPDASFKEGEAGLITIDFAQGAEMPEPQPIPDARDPQFAERQKRLAEQEATFAERQSALEAKEAELAKQQRNIREQGIRSFLEGLADKGRILPNQIPRLTALGMALDVDTIAFAEDGREVQENPLQVFQKFLAELPPRIDFSERAPAADGAGHDVRYDAPPGFFVDPERLRLHQKVAAFAEANGVSYEAAVQSVARKGE